MAVQRLVTTRQQPGEDARNWALRPRRLEEYIGQPDLVARLRISITAKSRRAEPLEHVLLHGPPGLGKTSLAYVIAEEMGSRVHITSGPALSRPLDLVSTLTRLDERDVLFIDEIHRLPASVEEFIYPAMEDFRIDVPVDAGVAARTAQVPLKPFTLIGATTRAGLMSAPLRDRFGLAHHLRYYDPPELLAILRRACVLLGAAFPGPGAGPATTSTQHATHADDDALGHIARRSRGTPRVAIRLLRFARDYAQVHGTGHITAPLVEEALRVERVDELGLDELDRQYLATIARVFDGGPVGVEAVAATMNEDAGTLEDVAEPYLLQIGFLARTRRGRMLTRAGAEHMGVTLRRPTDNGLFE